MTDGSKQSVSKDVHALVEETDEDPASGWPLVYALVTYASVAVALYAETGDPHVGVSWPVIAAIATLLLSVWIEWRHKDGD